MTKMTFPRVSELEAKLFPYFIESRLSEKSDSSKAELEQFQKYVLHLPNLNLKVKKYEGPNSCGEAEYYFSWMLQNDIEYYDTGIILTNDNTPFGIVKGVGDVYSFFPSHNLVNHKGKPLILRGGIYRINQKIQEKMNHLRSGGFNLLEVKSLYLQFDRMIIEENFNLQPNPSKRFDEIIYQASTYLKTGIGKFKKID